MRKILFYFLSVHMEHEQCSRERRTESREQDRRSREQEQRTGNYQQGKEQLTEGEETRRGLLTHCKNEGPVRISI
jgi:hypothetical protein